MHRQEFMLALNSGSYPLRTAEHADPSTPETEKSLNMIINRGNIETIFAAFKTTFSKAFDSTSSNYLDIAMKVSSATREETYAWLGTWPGIREWIGERVVRGLTAQAILSRT